ncbi:hypothetical protein [Sporosarcina sp. A2]|uniref:hypothetical protein n=1 Tax=Sporosarcina sp. A2 TaxID=3393449 RepID=UPI003D7AC609
MKTRYVFLLLLLLSLSAIFVVSFENPPEVQALNEEKAIPEPCSLILEPVDKKLKNAKGVALVYKVQLNPPSFARTNISILAVHLPEPSSYGDYDSYEGFAYIPEEISWRFKLYPTPEVGSPSWAGRFDLITAEMKNVEVQVRLSNTKTDKLGPSVLTNTISYCK